MSLAINAKEDEWALLLPLAGRRPGLRPGLRPGRPGDTWWPSLLSRSRYCRPLAYIKAENLKEGLQIHNLFVVSHMSRLVIEEDI